MSKINIQIHTGFVESFLFQVMIRKEDGTICYQGSIGNQSSFNLESNQIYTIDIVSPGLIPGRQYRYIKPISDCETIDFYFYYPTSPVEKTRLVQFTLTDRNYQNLPIEKGVINLGNI